MVMARLHLICGNCGCNDEWEWEHIPQEIDEGEVMVDENVSISCRNCSTIHSINGNAKIKKDACRRCPKCKAPRKDAKCWKCGEATFEPCEGWEDPKLPPIDRIRELAHEVGYAIGEHGSKERDLDVIAAPWTDKAVDSVDLLLHISNGLKGKILGGIENKPFGRTGTNIQLDGYYKAIDISVCPKTQNA
jgi:hypothetical protein